MSLLTNGYWNSRYFLEDFWADNFWLNGGGIVPSPLENGYWNSKYFVGGYWTDDYWGDYGVVLSEFLLLSLTQGFPLKIALTQEVL